MVKDIIMNNVSHSRRFRIDFERQLKHKSFEDYLVERLHKAEIAINYPFDEIEITTEFLEIAKAHHEYAEEYPSGRWQW